MNIHIERKDGKEIRWVNGVPYTRPRAKYVDYWEHHKEDLQELFGLMDCPDCDGSGLKEVRDDAREFDIDEKWKTIKCRLCDGVGEIENIEG